MINSSVTLNNLPPLETNTKIYNRQKYQIDIIFDNQQGNRFQLNLASLVSLDIEEDSREWYKRASLTIRNPDNVFEQQILANALPTQYYKFRNDGRDVVYIIVKLVQDNNIKESAVQLDYDVWGMSYKFVVVDREEIPNESPKLKQLKLYLWEYEQQILAETNLAWSTNKLLPSSIVPADATDAQKLVNTGTAIKGLLTEALQNYSAPVFTDTWDTGSSKIFYTAPANYTAADSLSYLLKKHVGTQIGTDNGADPCILSRTRYTNKWNLVSYSTLFSNAINNVAALPGVSLPTAGSLQREVITISQQAGNDTNDYSFVLPQTPYNSNLPNTNFADPITSYIQNINFVDMSTIDSMQEMVSTPCYSNNLTNKTFGLDFKNNDIQNVKSYIDKNYSSKLKLYSKPDTLITLNKTKTDTLAVKNVYSYSPDKQSQLAESRNFLLTSALFYNTSVSFKTLGLPLREVNTFIGIQRSAGSILDEFANKLLGQWFIYNVIHHFSETEYTNNITAFRVHANNNLNIKSNIT